nr:receptor-like serine/threonine-protein kinase SD1-8 [Ipomoea batatas]
MKKHVYSKSHLFQTWLQKQIKIWVGINQESFLHLPNSSGSQTELQVAGKWHSIHSLMRAAMESGSFLFWYFLILQILIPRFTIAVDTITPTQPLAQNQTLVSAGGVFQLGFFSPGGNFGGLYVGIWYKEIQDRTIVWVANRDKPITNSTGFLKIGEDGNINLVDGTRNSIWSSSNQSVRGNTIAQLLDSGNLVLRRENDENPENYLWESFDYCVNQNEFVKHYY